MNHDWRAMAAATLVEPGRTVQLSRDFDPGRTGFVADKHEAKKVIGHAKSELFALQDRFYAQADRSMLIVLQAMDAAGKDSLVKNVMAGMNPQGVSVTSFKSPTSIEREHDYLWRHQRALPELGRIAVFNRSHYENVLITRVHPELLWPATPATVRRGIWQRRFDQINAWERYLTDNGTTVVKFFLHVSKREQLKRFLKRIDDPAKNWKYSSADAHERGFWQDYEHAHDEMLSNTSTDASPWHVLPADTKWFTRLSALAVLLDVLNGLNPQYPMLSPAERVEIEKARPTLLEEN